ncbi:MAG: head GIN domain-containing protein [Sphingomicrobium sp.]
MRTFLIAAALAGSASPADAATRNFGITGFTKIRVDGPFKVSLTTGVAPFARASGSGPALDRVEIDVRGDTLVVHSSASSWGGYPGTNAGPVEINVGTHELGNAWLNGAGSLVIDRVKGLTFALSVQGSGRAEIALAQADQMTVSLVGTGSAKLSGQAKRLTTLVRGISTLDATGLAAPTATIAAEGAATIDANVTDSATVQASGPATIRLTGRPSCTLKVTGSTTVSGCR